VLRAIGLTKRYPATSRPALDSLDLDVHDGEILFLLGANGAGKTTTLNCFLDFTTPTSGRAEVDGIVVADRPIDAKRRLAFLSENVAAYGTLTPRQNLRFFARLGGHQPELSPTATDDALAHVGLPPAAFDRPARELSKGMRQKLGVAVALARHAPNLMLDEPTSGLDPAAADDFMLLLAHLKRDGRAILMSTHDVFRARDYADRAAFLRAGRLVALLSHDELQRQDPTALYLASTSADHPLDARPSTLT
jgi:ABC-2 type transport system ATP-binding protein